MLTFNRPQFIRRAVESVRRQTFQDWELLVVHDGPNEEIAAILTQLAAEEPRLRYLRRTEQGNIAQANNYGLARARGAYVAILDDDDFWARDDKLELQVRHMDATPECVACGGGSICIDLAGRETMKYLKPSGHDDIVRNALMANPMVHSTTLYRRGVAERIGYYDETLAGFQDWDLFLKLAREGRLHNFPDYLLYYQIWEGGGSFQAQRRNTESALRIVRRHGRHYRNYPAALAMVTAYYLYARLPLVVRTTTFSFFSRLKKSIFSTRSAQA